MFAIARVNAPNIGLFLGVIFNRFQGGTAVFMLAHDEFTCSRPFGVQKLVGIPAAAPRIAHAIADYAAFAILGFDSVTECFRKTLIELRGARIEQIRVVQHLVVGIVFGTDTERVRLNPEIDVLRYKRDLAFRVTLAEVECDTQQCIVWAGGRQAVRQLALDGIGVKIQTSGSCSCDSGRQLHTSGNVAIDMLHQIVDETTDLPYVARRFGHAHLRMVELFKHNDG